MKRKIRIGLSLLTLAACCLCLFTACAKQDPQEKSIEKLLTKWSDKQPEYLEKAFMGSFSKIGIGQQDLNKSGIEAFNDAADKEYGEYFTVEGLEMFKTNLLLLPILAQQGEISLKIADLKIKIDNDYIFECTVKCTQATDDTKTKEIPISGKISFKDGKIRVIEMRDIEELSKYIYELVPIDEYIL